MITTESIYLDTSVPSAYYDERNPVRMQMTQDFWANVLPNYETLISEVTVAEILQTKDEGRRDGILSLVQGLTALSVTPEVRGLATAFKDSGLVPERKWEDALHLASAVAAGADYLVSWNFDHMVNVRIQKRLPVVCAQQGYFRQMLIVSPLEFLGGGQIP